MGPLSGGPSYFCTAKAGGKRMTKEAGASPEEGIGVLPMDGGRDGDEEVYIDDGSGGKADERRAETRDAAKSELDGSDAETGGEPLDEKRVDVGDEGDEGDEGAQDREFRIPERRREAKPEDEGARDRDEDLDDFPAKVRKRINREVRLKHEAEERARRAEERALRLEMEISKQRSEREMASLDEQIAERKAKLKQARAELDTDAEADLIAELSALAAKKATAATETGQPPQRSADEVRRVTAWYERNAWMNDERYAWKKEIAMEVNASLLREGFKPTSDEFYEELDARIAQRARARQKPMERSPVDDGGRREGLDRDDGETRRTTRRPTRVLITESDKRDMRRYGLDPNNPQHLKTWAAEKVASGD